MMSKAIDVAVDRRAMASDDMVAFKLKHVVIKKTGKPYEIRHGSEG